MNKTFLVVLTAVLLAGTGRADPATQQAALDELFQVMEMDKVLDATIEAQVEAMARRQPQMGIYSEVMKKFFRKYLSWEALKPDTSALYLKAFTEEELRDLVTFYKTPTGQKALKKMPELMTAGAKIGQQRVQEHADELREMIDAEATRIKLLQEESATTLETPATAE